MALTLNEQIEYADLLAQYRNLCDSEECLLKKKADLCGVEDVRLNSRLLQVSGLQETVLHRVREFERSHKTTLPVRANPIWSV